MQIIAFKTKIKGSIKSTNFNGNIFCIYWQEKKGNLCDKLLILKGYISKMYNYLYNNTS